MEPIAVAPVVLPKPAATLTTQAGTTQSRHEKVTWGLHGIVDNSLVRATAPEVAALLRECPDLFVLDWTAFRHEASLGRLDGFANVEPRVHYVYQQRTPKGKAGLG